MKTKDHLPLFGAGPVYVITISIMTASALFLHYMGSFPVTVLPEWLLICFKVIGALLVLEGITIWCYAVFDSKLTKNIKENHLITDGVYSIVRHPIYSAFTLAEWGLLIWTGNLWLFLLIPMYWLFFTLLIQVTEEKWLLKQYGREYEEYSRRVNRCIPIFFKRKFRSE